MLIFIILIAVAISGLLLWIFSYFEELGMILAAIGGFLLCICTVCCFVINVTPQAKVIEWEEKTSYLQTRKEMLEQVHPIINSDGEITSFTSDIYLHFDNPSEYYEAIDNYNKEVRDFVVMIKSGKCKRDNWMIGWFYSPAYNQFDQTKLEGLSYSVGR